jgi:hypothetical protein
MRDILRNLLENFVKPFLFCFGKVHETLVMQLSSCYEDWDWIEVSMKSFLKRKQVIQY